MKHISFILIALTAIVACTKESVKLKEVDDVCTMMDDINFMKYCYDNFDVNHDGKVSMEEAAAVKEIGVGHKNYNSLKGIEYFSAITDLYCSKNNLTSLDVSKNTQLTYLHCSDNSLVSLDVSKNTQLTYFNCSNNDLTSLDVSKNTQLTYFNCSDNSLVSLDVSKNTQLTTLYCDNNNLTSLDVSKNTNLEGLACSNNNLTSLDISKNTNLKHLQCSYNNLNTLDFSNNNQLGECSYNPQKNGKVKIIGGSYGPLYGIWVLDSRTDITTNSSGQETRDEVDYSSFHFYLAFGRFPFPHAIAKKGSFTEDFDLNDVDVDAARIAYIADKGQINFYQQLLLSEDPNYLMRLSGTYDILELTDKRLVFQQVILGTKISYSYHKQK